MGSYGRNIEFRVTPEEYMRRGRIILGQGSDVPIGVPLLVGTTPDPLWTGALPATLATGAQAPSPGMSGLGIYEWVDFNGLDEQLFSSSDRDKIPNGKQFQLISGKGVKVVFKNTTAHSFMGTRNYAGRTMVAGMGATPTVLVGDYLTPGTGSDAAGYWARTATATQGWLRVTNVDATRQEVEAEFVF